MEEERGRRRWRKEWWRCCDANDSKTRFPFPLHFPSPSIDSTYIAPKPAINPFFFPFCAPFFPSVRTARFFRPEGKKKFDFRPPSNYVFFGPWPDSLVGESFSLFVSVDSTGMLSNFFVRMPTDWLERELENAINGKYRFPSLCIELPYLDNPLHHSVPSPTFQWRRPELFPSYYCANFIESVKSILSIINQTLSPVVRRRPNPTSAAIKFWQAVLCWAWHHHTTRCTRDLVNIVPFP